MRIKDWPAILYITYPRSGAARYLCRVCGIGMPGAEITLRIDGSRIARTSVDEFGRWCFEKEVLPLLKYGDHSIKVIHHDGIGADEYAYANLNIIVDEKKTSGGREEYCTTQNDPSLNIFHLDNFVPSNPPCLTSAEVVDESLKGWFVNNNYLPKHRLKIRITNNSQAYISDEWYESIDTEALSKGGWALSPAGNARWNKFIVDYFSFIGGSGPVTFCFEVWDLDTGAYDTMCFCVTNP
jgi:hypothetical protein